MLDANLSQIKSLTRDNRMLSQTLPPKCFGVNKTELPTSEFSTLLLEQMMQKIKWGQITQSSVGCCLFLRLGTGKHASSEQTQLQTQMLQRPCDITEMNNYSKICCYPPPYSYSPSLLFGSAIRQIFQIICKVETVCVVCKCCYQAQGECPI